MHRYGIEDIRQALAAHRPETCHSEKSARRAAVAVILHEAPESGLSTLFIKRAEHPLDPWSGHMAFPGGHQEEGDATIADAAVRETLEEVGLDLRGAHHLGRLDDLGGGRLGSFNMSVSPFVYLLGEPPKLLLNEEIADAIWVPLSYLGDPANVKPYFYPADPQRRPFPAYHVEGGYTIWGMTYRMVCSFLEVFGINHPAEGEMTDVE